ncbi:josephin-2 isoform X3 [Haemorhous mexicanus]|uniref:josephin-2 isoform X3 n=1 Tax=Haemorhous mexicanus TaxID=30427 RepID=UPI0028BDC146|nr:josephin-2 isoform X3 [Haemorhous mexicanus]
MAPEDARAPQASPSPSPDLGGVLEDLPDLGRGLPGFGSGVPGYHERQRRQLCALHALNNLLQRPWLSQASADRICQRPLERLCLSHVLGFLLNVPSRVALGTLALPLSRPHWLCVRPFGGTFYNLDSKLATPTAIGAEPQLREFLRAALAQGPSELFLVVARDVEEAGTWLSPE